MGLVQGHGCVSSRRHLSGLHCFRGHPSCRLVANILVLRLCIFVAIVPSDVVSYDVSFIIVFTVDSVHVADGFNLWVVLANLV
jgi:hypothetical protein